MPIYEYYCPKCDSRFDVLVRRADAPPPVCPACGSKAVERIFSPFAQSRQVERREALAREGERAAAQGEQALAEFLHRHESALADDESDLVRSDAFREVIHRRLQGATDDDMQDITRDWPSGPEGAAPPGVEAPLRALAQLYNLEQDHEHDHSSTQTESKKRARRHSKHIGWG